LLAALLLGAMVVALDAGGCPRPGLDRVHGPRGSVSLLWLVVAARRPSFATVRPNLATVGGAPAVLDNLANLLFVLAAARGLLSLVSVLGSLYPVVTVVLARVVLDERLARWQLVGVGGGAHRRGADLARLKRTHPTAVA
jgi:drug/metabolite transporter (DMT)-like permease